MAGKLSFAIAINLLTENFKRGANQVKSALRTLQMQFLTFAAALGAGGLGLTNLVSRFIDVARETNRVTTALKNVSGTMSRYADSQRYLLGIAKKYGLEINALTGNYAKFTAAANASGMSMMEQQKIFESVSRACTAFGMSADDSNGVFLALSQMMSKGKISSEELRLQMGERLPVAIQAMAKAAGVTVGELDKLLKQGKVMSADVLPKFAEALDGMIPNVDTDNLETSVNRLKNTFTELVNSFDIQGKYKAVVDWVNGALGSIQSGISGLVAFIVSLLGGKLLSSVISYFGSYWKSIDTTIAKAEAAQTQMALATQKRIEAEKVLEQTKTDFETRENGKRLASALELNRAKLALEQAQLNEKKAIEAAKTATEQASAVGSVSVWGKIFKSIKLGLAGVGMAIKAAFSALWVTALITAVSALIGYFVNLYKEAKRVRGIFDEYKKAEANIKPSAEVSQLETLRSVANDTNISVEKRKKVYDEIAKRLDIVRKKNESDIDFQKRINGEISKRIKLLEATAKADFYMQRKVAAEDQRKQVQNKLGVPAMSQGNIDYITLKLTDYQKTGSRKSLQKALDTYTYEARREGSEIPEDYETRLIELANLQRVIDDTSGEIAKNVSIMQNLEAAKSADTNDTGGTGNTDGASGGPDKTPIQKAEEDYRDSLATYKNQLDSGAITQGKYNEEIDKLNNDTVLKIGGMLGKSAEANETYARALLGTLNPRVTESANALEELAEVQAQYKKDTDLANTKLGKKLITEDEYRQALIEAAAAAANSAVSIEGIGTAADGFISEMQNVIGENIDKGIKMPKLGARDTTFDYKKTDIDKNKERLDIWVSYRDDLEKQLEKVKNKSGETAKHLQNEFNKAILNVDNLEDALKFAEVEQDIEEYSKSLWEASYSGIKDIVSSADRMVSSFENLNDVLDDADSTEWEKIMAYWNAMVSAIDSVNSIISTIENLIGITERLTAAKQVEAAVDTAAVQKKVSNTALGVTADITAATVKKETATEEIAANTATAASEAGKSAAKLPFPWNIVAIGGAIAAVIAAMAVIPKFANGGIVTGNSTSGDKVLARLNSGEMVLNAGQQSRLFNAINSGNLGSNGSGNVMIGVDRVRGSDIYLSLKNYMKTTGKKL